MAQPKGQGKEKEPAASVTNVYLHVVEDVIQSVRDEFQSEGVDESVLVELRQLWELKMMQAGAIQGSSFQELPAPIPSRAGVTLTPVHDLNVPYEATEEYQTPTVDLLFPPTPQAMTPVVSTPLPMTPQTDVMLSHVETASPALTSTGEPIMFQYIPPGPSESVVGGDGGLDVDTKPGRPASFMQQPAPWMNQKPRGVDVNIDMNATYEEGQEEDESGLGQAPITKDFFTLAMGKRKRDYITQQDGAGDSPQIHQYLVKDGECVSERLASRRCNPEPWRHERCDVDARLCSTGEVIARPGSSHIPQCDGIDDVYDDGVAEEDYNEPGEEEPQPATDAGSRVLKVEPAARDSDGGEPPLNEDDDDEVDDNDQGDEEPQTEHLVLAQFDKVTRSKNKWKCTLKDGIMHLNNKDILFVKATGEFEF
ncbi:unnamed protein product [Calypogeia fissa]